jgi:N-acetylglucosamine-6-phosphate deacetylase
MSSSRYGITADLLVTSGRRIAKPLVVVAGGRIESVASREEAETPRGLETFDFKDAVLAPGLVDIHIHGGGGHDVMEGEEDALRAIEQHLARTGVTSYFPTTVTAPVEATLKSLEKLGAAIERAQSPGHESQNGRMRAQPVGIHLEGPFISHARCGVHPVNDIQAPSVELFERMCQAAGGHVSVMTVAPEVPGALDLIRTAAGRGVCVSLGHSDSGLDTAASAVRNGARHATHTFNAMRPLDHRDPGILGAVLSDDALTADIIADGIHVHPDVVRLFLRAKGSDRAVLITDAISATGMGDGSYRLGSFTVEVKGERCLHNGKLAGSVLTLNHAVRNAMKFGGVTLEDAVKMATLNPARAAGVATRNEAGKTIPWKGVIQPGADADIVVFTREMEVMRTFAGA